MRILLSTLALSTLLLQGAHANPLPYTISGIPRIIDGDTVTIDGKRIRLACVDAPEQGQYCLDTRTDCGALATAYLKGFLGYRKVSCKILRRDHFNRRIGLCHRYPGEVSISERLIKDGYAVFVNIRYCAHKRYWSRHEQHARENRLGLFRQEFGGFENPLYWRRSLRQK